MAKIEGWKKITDSIWDNNWTVKRLEIRGRNLDNRWKTYVLYYGKYPEGEYSSISKAKEAAYNFMKLHIRG